MRTYKVLYTHFTPRNGQAAPMLDLDLRNTVTGLYRSILLRGDEAVRYRDLKVNDEWTEEK